MAQHDWINRPDVEKAHHFESGICEDPKCGLHIIPKRKDGTPICEMIVSQEGMHAMMEHIKDILYRKAVENDNGQG